MPPAALLYNKVGNARPIRRRYPVRSACSVTLCSRGLATAHGRRFSWTQASRPTIHRMSTD